MQERTKSSIPTEDHDARKVGDDDEPSPSLGRHGVLVLVGDRLRVSPLFGRNSLDRSC
jgi:hypothetical protein